MIERARNRAEDDYLRADNFKYGSLRKVLTLGSPHLGTSLANAFINLHNHYSHDTDFAWAIQVFEKSFTSNQPERIHNGAICDLSENGAATSYTSMPAVLSHAHAGGAGEVGALTPPLALLALNNLFGNARETALDPYMFATLNDGIVEEFSAWGNLALESDAVVTHEDLYHNDDFSPTLRVPPLKGNLGIASDQVVASQVVDALDTDFGWAPLPTIERQFGNEYPSIGVPWNGGRGNIDHINWAAQCQVGGPLNLMGLPWDLQTQPSSD